MVLKILVMETIQRKYLSRMFYRGVKNIKFLDYLKELISLCGHESPSVHETIKIFAL